MATAERTKKLMVSSTVGIVQRLLQVVGTLVTMPLVLHSLGTEQFGVWGAAASIAWMGGMVDFGLGSNLLTAVASAVARGKPEEARDRISAGLGLSLCLTVIVMAGSFAVIAHWASAAEAPGYYIATGCLALAIPLSLANNIWLGLQEGYIGWSWDAVQTVLLLGGFITLSLIGADVKIYIAVTFGAALASNLGSFCHLMIRHPEIRPYRPSLPSTLVKDLLQRGLPYFVLGATMTLAIHVDNIIALEQLGGDAAGHMAIVQRACITAYSLIGALAQPLWPAFTDAVTRADKPWVRAHIWRGGLVIAACAIGGSLLIILGGRPLLHLWLGDAFELTPATLWAMAAWIVIPALGRLPDMLLNALGVLWFQVAVGVVYSGLALALKLLLAPRLGIGGILLGTAFSYGLTHLPAYLFWLWRWLQKIDAPPPA